MTTASTDKRQKKQVDGEGKGASRRRLDLPDLGYRYGVLIALFLIPVYFSLKRPDTYFTVLNLQTILSTQSVLVVLTLGLTVALVVNEFDLSIGAVYGWSAILCAILTANEGWPLGLAILACLASGFLIGCINGALVVGIGINSFITTLGTGTVLGGLTLVVSGSSIVSGVPTTLVNAVSATKVLGLSLSVYYALALALVLWYVYEFTPVGRYLYFSGFGPTAARLSGVRVHAMRFWALAATATVAALAGVFQAGTLGGADPTAGNSVLLPAFAGAYLGATTIKPGRFNVWGSVIGLYLLVSGITGLQLIGASGYAEQLFNGAALVLAVMFAQIMSRRRRSA